MASLIHIIFTLVRVVFTHFLFYSFFFGRSHKWTSILQGIECGNVLALNIVPFSILLEVLVVLHWSPQFLMEMVD